MISTIIPCYNSEKTIKKCISAILLLGDIISEIIIIDDFSSDQTIQLIKDFNNPKIKLYSNEKNLGPAFSRNRAVQLSTSYYIMFCDSDVEIVNANIEQILFSEKDNHSFSGLQGVYVAECPIQSHVTQYKHWQQMYHQSRWPEGPLPYMSTSLLVLKREYFLKHGGLEQRIKGASLEDRILGAKLYADQTPVVVMKEFKGNHYHQFTLFGLMKLDFKRALDEVKYSSILTSGKKLVSPTKKFFYLLFLIALCLTPLIFFNHSIYFFVIIMFSFSVLYDVYSIAQLKNDFLWKWPIIAFLDLLAISTGALCGLLLKLSSKNRFE